VCVQSCHCPLNQRKFHTLDCLSNSWSHTGGQIFVSSKWLSQKLLAVKCYLVLYSTIILGAFATLLKAIISLVISVCPRGTTRLPLNGIPWNLIFWVFFETVQKIRVSLKYYGNNGYFTWRRMYSYDTISQFYSDHGKCVGQKLLEKIKTCILCSTTFFLPKTLLLWDNVKVCTSRQATDNIKSGSSVENC
jgi:hypothetical protein